jgi:hypothetical protein
VSGRRLPALLVVTLALTAGPLAAGDVPGAEVELRSAPGTPGSEPGGAPPRFVLLKDGQVFVGGTAAIETARLDKGELRALRKRVDAVRKAVGKGQSAAADGPQTRLVLSDPPLELAIAGDPEQARPAALGALVSELVHFDHPALALYLPASYALSARSGQLVGGCRPWTFAFPIDDATRAAVTVAASDAVGWPTGAWPASVCGGDRHYVVTLRPLLPGETP